MSKWWPDRDMRVGGAGVTGKCRMKAFPCVWKQSHVCELHVKPEWDLRACGLRISREPYAPSSRLLASLAFLYDVKNCIAASMCRCMQACYQGRLKASAFAGFVAALCVTSRLWAQDPEHRMLDTCRRALEVSDSPVLTQRDSLGCQYADVRSALSHLANGFCPMRSSCRRCRACVSKGLVVDAYHSAATRNTQTTILLPSEL